MVDRVVKAFFLFSLSSPRETTGHVQHGQQSAKRICAPASSLRMALSFVCRYRRVDGAKNGIRKPSYIGSSIQHKAASDGM